MLLTLPIISAIFLLASDSSALNIFNAIRRYYPGQRFPESDKPGFLGWDNVTQHTLVKTIEALHETSGWLDIDNATRQAVFSQIATMISTATGEEYAPILRFCNLCFIAAKGNADIKNYFANPSAKYTIFEDIGARIGDKVESVTQTVEENVEYLVTPQTTTTWRINPVVKWGLILFGGYVLFSRVLKTN